uniref:Lipocalin n=1 Tax=Rhipicephalus appendiculatus TaxID=34631 RepID=A0A131YNS3_RHIAP
MTPEVRMSRAVVAIHVLLAFLQPTVMCLGEHKLSRNQTNAFQVFDIFADGVAVYTSSNDPSLKCLTAERQEYKPNKKVVYTWKLNGDQGSKKETYVVEYYPGPTNDTVFAIVNNDEKHPMLVKLDYSNNKNCVVANFPYKGEVCILWVPKAYVSSVPQECVDQFEDICDAEVPDYQDGLCDQAVSSQ